MPDLLAWMIDNIGNRLEVYRRITCRVCMVAGPVFLGFALVYLVSTFRFLHRCIPATGTVVQLVPEIDREDNSVTYRPTFHYVAKDGQTYEVRSRSSSNPPAFVVGQTVPVLYEPSRPAEAKLNWFWDLWGMSVAFGIIGGVATILALVLRMYQRRLDCRGLSITPRANASSAQ
jgi:hypothetical protein